MARRVGIKQVEAIAAVAAVGLVAFLVTSPLPTRGMQVVDNVTQLVAPAVAAALALRLARRRGGRLRASWRLIGLACLSWAAGQAVWTWYEVVLAVDVPSPSLADVGYLGALPLLLAGLARYPVAGLLPMGRLRLVLDATTMGLGLLLSTYGTFLGPILESSDESTSAGIVAVTYPVADLAALAVVTAVLARRHDGRRGPLPRLVGALVSLTVADCAFTYLTAVGELGDAPVNAGWVIGFGLIGLATFHVELDDRHGLPSAAAPAALRLETAVPLVPVLAAGAVLVGRSITGAGIGPFLSVTAAALLVCVAVRQLAIQLENAELTRDLESIVVALRNQEDELQHRAFHDPLTGLANRDLFRNRLDHALSRRRTEQVSVIFVDLDDFKTVNDSLGHDAGDTLLVLVAERLRASVRAGDTAARLGGDEFAVLLDDDNGERLAARVLESLEVPFTIGTRELHVGASIGVAVGRPSAVTAEQLLQDADLAMYAAKAAGGGQWASFEPAMREGAVMRLDLLHDLDLALEHDELSLHFQPVFRLAVPEIAGYEALLRWEHPTRGLLHPEAFLELAEETGRILPIGWWALEAACRAQRHFPRQPGVPAPAVSVNLSPRQVRDPGAAHAVAHALAVSGVDPDRVVLELPESTLLAGEEEIARLRRLRDLGVRLAVDDFGTGYSSLAYLSRLPVDIVKIDRSFIDRLEVEGGAEQLLIAAIVQLCDGLGLRTIAEGVEHEWQLDRLRRLGVDGAQGFLLGPPAPEPRPAPASPLPAIGQDGVRRREVRP